MEYFTKVLPRVIHNMVSPPRRQEWATKPNQNTIILIGDDILDNHLTTDVDVTAQINQKEELTCFNCAVNGSNLNSLLTNEKPSLIARLSRDYEYPNCDDFDVLNWVDRSHWVVFSAGVNEKRDIPVELLEKQLRIVMGKILEKNKQCVVVTIKEWSEWANMVQKVCDELNVDLLYNSSDLAEQIFNITKHRVKQVKHVVPASVMSLPTLDEQ